MRHINMEEIEYYRHELLEAEKSKATVEKYIRDIRKFVQWLGNDETVSKDRTIQYKQYLKEPLQGQQCQQHVSSVKPLLSVSGVERMLRQRSESPAADVLPGVAGTETAGI